MVKRLAGFSLSTILLLLAATISIAQQISFRRVSPAEDYNWGLVTGITQDQQGYMWIGTQTGLYRFDGYQWSHYRHDPKAPNSLANDRIEALHADSKGMLWIGTFGSGLDRLDPLTGKFTHFPHNPKDKTSLGDDSVTVILEDRSGVLWVGTHEGLDRFNAQDGTFTHFQHDPSDPHSLCNDQVRALYEDRQGTLWVGTGSPFANETPKGQGGLNRLDRKTGKFKRYLHRPGDNTTLIDNKVRAIFEDSRGNFWVGTHGDGLHSMDRAKGTFTRYTYDPAHPEKLSRPYPKEGKTEDGITFIQEDATGALWIGSYLGGINRYDAEKKQVTFFRSGESSGSDSYGDNGAWVFYQSREGVAWIGSSWAGYLYKFDPLRLHVQQVNVGASVDRFCEESDHVLWLATTSGAMRFDFEKNQKQHFQHDINDKGSLSDNYATSIIRSREGDIWIGTDTGGLNRYDRHRRKFIRYQHDPKNPQTIGHGTIVSILQVRDGTLWMGLIGGGLNHFNPKTGVFERYLHQPGNPESSSNDLVTLLAEDREGMLWFGHWDGGGVDRFDRKTGRFSHYLQGENITNILEASDGSIWVGSEKALFVRQAGTDEFVKYINPRTKDTIKPVSSVLEDNERNLWVSSVEGLYKIAPQRDEAKLYGKGYGINGNNIDYAKGYKGRRGDLYFGTFTGYYHFFPDKMRYNQVPPLIAFNDFRLFNKSVQPGEDSPLPVPLEQAKEVKLPYNENVFSINFAALHFSNPEENQLRFQLVNYDTAWREAGLERTASYFKVPAGHYVFRVKASNSDGVWSERSIPVIISPPWWNTWWAYGLFALALGGSIWGFIEYRSHSLKRENRLLEEKVLERTAEVEARNREVQAQRDQVEETLRELQATQTQLIQSEKMASLGELTAGIAHEIQNPLNFVNNFSEVSVELCGEVQQELAAGKVDDAQLILKDLTQNLQKICCHGKRADSIVKNMLQHSRASTGEKQPTDINGLADEYLRLSYHGLRAKDKTFNASLITDFDPSLGCVHVVPQEMGRVLLNLFNNAFYAVHQKKKALQNNYQPEVRVSTCRKKSKLEIRVRDNGTGICQESLHKIFQPFFTTKPTGQGTGLGLSLSYDIVTKGHGGNMKVDTKEGEFAEFVISLPLSC